VSPTGSPTALRLASSQPPTPSCAAADLPVHHPSAELPPAIILAALPASRASIDVPRDPAAPAPAIQPRASLDSMLHQHQQRERAAAAAAARGAASAAAADRVPVNEQPMLPTAGPRMSNAVARKLGLAPPKPPAGAAAVPGLVPGIIPAAAVSAKSPQRGVPGAGSPFDALIHGVHPVPPAMQPIDAHLAAALGHHQAMLDAHQAAAFYPAVDPHAAGMGSYGAGAAASGGYPQQTEVIHPALLSLVANITGPGKQKGGGVWRVYLFRF
jgi:hypothetical protein